ncbi:MAG: hypothetical protein V1867_06470 [Candidatus Falkowbacteria bacterium]
MKKGHLIILLSIVYIILLVSYLFIKDEALGSGVSGIAYLLPPLMCVIGGFYAIKLYGVRNLSIFLIVLGFACWFIAEAMWIVSGYFDDRQPLLWDFFYLLGYPFLIAGSVLEIKKGKIAWTFNRVTITAAFSVLSVYLAMHYGVIAGYDKGLPWLNNAINIFYGVGDIILAIMTVLIILIIREYRGGKIFFPWLYMLIGMILFVVADIAYAANYSLYVEGLWPYRGLDFFWGLAYLFFSYSLFSFGFLIKDVQRKLVPASSTKES